MADALAPPKLGYRPMPHGRTSRNPRGGRVPILGSFNDVQETIMAKPLAPIAHILAGAELGRLSLIREVDPIARTGDGGRIRRALFRCSCGSEPTLRVDNVKRGLTRSCGCFNIDVIRSRSAPLARESSGRAK